MKRFLQKIIIFSFFGMIVGEIIARLFILTSDVPQRIIDEAGIQKYKPNQKGSWKGGTHKWQINEKGWPGELPDKYDNLITIIGDSYIESFMNKDECHQSNYLKELMPDYNFMEAARSGVSFIEALEISKQLDDVLNPKYQLIYLYDSDFHESITQIKKLFDITQVDLEKKEIINGKMKAPGLKKILYNWKFVYFLYNRFPLNFNSKKSIKKPLEKNEKPKNILFKELLMFAKENYNFDNKILVFRPNSNEKIIQLTEELGFKIILLESNKEKLWSFDHDPHWTCYGHSQAAIQVANFCNSKLN